MLIFPRPSKLQCRTPVKDSMVLALLVLPWNCHCNGHRTNWRRFPPHIHSHIIHIISFDFYSVFRLDRTKFDIIIWCIVLLHPVVGFAPPNSLVLRTSPDICPKEVFHSLARWKVRPRRFESFRKQARGIHHGRFRKINNVRLESFSMTHHPPPSQPPATSLA